MKINSCIITITILLSSFLYSGNLEKMQEVYNSTQTPRHFKELIGKQINKNEKISKKMAVKKTANPQTIETSGKKTDESFKPGEIYCRLKSPDSKDYIIHIETGIADEVELTITDTKSYQINKVKFSDKPKIINGKYAYEYVWMDLAGGEYKFTAVARKGNKVLNFEGECKINN